MAQITYDEVNLMLRLYDMRRSRGCARRARGSSNTFIRNRRKR